MILSCSHCTTSPKTACGLGKLETVHASNVTLIRIMSKNEDIISFTKTLYSSLLIQRMAYPRCLRNNFKE